eukprot:1194730-Prorocentrum_minimum.AAC.5
MEARLVEWKSRRTFRQETRGRVVWSAGRPLAKGGVRHIGTTSGIRHTMKSSTPKELKKWPLKYFSPSPESLPITYPTPGRATPVPGQARLMISSSSVS